MDLVTGLITKAHGIKGDVVVQILTDEPDERFAIGKIVELKDFKKNRESLRAKILRVKDLPSKSHDKLVASLDISIDRNMAESLQGFHFIVDSDKLTSKEDSDEYYDFELENLKVQIMDGTCIGKISEVIHSSSGELLEVLTDENKKVLIPFVKEIVPVVDIKLGFIKIDPPEGLLEL